jgi:hypothetical protein
VPFYIRRKHLILESTDRLLEGLALALEASVTVNLGTEGTITELPDGLLHVVVPHIVSIEESQNVSRDERRRYVDVYDSCYVSMARSARRERSWICG